MYPLDLDTMLAMMKEYRRTGMMSAVLPSGVGSMQQPGRVEVMVKSGAVVACRIVGTNGQIIAENQEALRLVKRMGRLDWVLTFPQAFPTSPALQAASKTEADYAPRRVHRQITSEQIASWSRLQRQVYALVDGKKTAEQMAAILSLPAARVRQVLLELNELGLIVLVPDNTM